MSFIDEVEYKEAVKAHRKEHDCKCCKYYEKPRQCNGELHCLMEEELQISSDRRKAIIRLPCPHDKKGGCPYGNESGTCFGFCLQKILKEMHGKE